MLQPENPFNNVKRHLCLHSILIIVSFMLDIFEWSIIFTMKYKAFVVTYLLFKFLCLFNQILLIIQLRAPEILFKIFKFYIILYFIINIILSILLIVGIILSIFCMNKNSDYLHIIIICSWIIFHIIHIYFVISEYFLIQNSKKLYLRGHNHVEMQVVIDSRRNINENTKKETANTEQIDSKEIQSSNFKKESTIIEILGGESNEFENNSINNNNLNINMKSNEKCDKVLNINGRNNNKLKIDTRGITVDYKSERNNKEIISKRLKINEINHENNGHMDTL